MEAPRGNSLCSARGSSRAGIFQRSSGLGTTNHVLSLRRTGTFSTSGRNHTPALGTWYAIRWKNPWERDRDSKKKIKIQDLVRHALILCGAQVPQGRASRGNLARELSEASSLEKGTGKRKRDAPSVSILDGPSLMNPFTQRLLTRWRSRRQGAYFLTLRTRTRMKQFLVSL